VRFFLAGGAGDVGTYLAEFLAARGHETIVFDRSSAAGKMAQPKERVIFVSGDLQDREAVKAAVSGADVVVNLAWSFSDDAVQVFREDILGHINLLEVAAAAKVKKFIYASTATVYGAPQAELVTEEHPCLFHAARKPLYALGKRTAEELCSFYRLEKGLPYIVLRFWWAFGDSIGGKNLRQMIRTALRGEPVKVAVGAGGTFVTMEDVGRFILSAAGNERASSGIYNIGSLFLTWSEIAAMIIKEMDSRSQLRELPAEGWDGPAFLGERWRLSWEKAEKDIGYRPARSETEAREAFKQALSRCIEEVRNAEKQGAR